MTQNKDLKIFLFILGMMMILPINVLAIFPGECAEVTFPNDNNVSFELVPNSTILSGFTWSKNDSLITYCFSTGSEVGNFTLKWSDIEGTEVVETPSSSGGSGGGSSGGAAGGSYKSFNPPKKPPIKIIDTNPDTNNNSSDSSSEKNDDNNSDTNNNSSAESSDNLLMTYFIFAMIVIIVILLFIRRVYINKIKSELSLNKNKPLKGGLKTKKDAKTKTKNNAK